MLVNCKKGCFLNGGVTTVKLNLDTNEAVCDFCEEDIPGISNYAKDSLRACGNVTRDKVIESFSFLCNFCNQNVRTVIVDGLPCGKGCGDINNCSISISNEMIFAIEATDGRQVRDDD
jgi:hypothetical protein